jgi:hypothetical protein
MNKFNVLENIVVAPDGRINETLTSRNEFISIVSSIRNDFTRVFDSSKYRKVFTLLDTLTLTFDNVLTKKLRTDICMNIISVIKEIYFEDVASGKIVESMNLLTLDTATDAQTTNLREEFCDAMKNFDQENLKNYVLYDNEHGLRFYDDAGQALNDALTLNNEFIFETTGKGVDLVNIN